MESPDSSLSDAASSSLDSSASSMADIRSGACSMAGIRQPRVGNFLLTGEKVGTSNSGNEVPPLVQWLFLVQKSVAMQS